MTFKQIISSLLLNIKHIAFVLFSFYFLNLLLGRLPGQLVKTYLNKEIGNTLAIDKNVDRFDFPMLSDFLINHGSGVSIILKVAGLIFLIYFLVHCFFLSGWINALINLDQHDYKRFLNRASSGFWRLLRLEFYVLVLYLAILGIANYGFAAKGLNPFDQISDAALLNRFLICNGIALIFTSLVSLWHQLAKFYVIDSEKRIITSSLVSTLKVLGSNFASVLGIQLVYIFLISLVFGIAYIVISSFSFSSTISHWVYILIVQLLILVLIYFKLTKHHAFSKLYKDIVTKNVSTVN